MDDFLQEIEEALSKIPGRPSYIKIKEYGKKVAVWKLFEVFIFTILIQAFKEEGFSVNHKVTNASSKDSNSLRVRQSPGKVNTSKKFSYFVVQQNGTRYEVHAGIQAEGKSTVLHEIDVGVFEINTSQVNPSKPIPDPDFKSVKLAIECKHYEKREHAKGLSRDFLGLSIDLGRDQDQRGIIVTRKYDEDLCSICETHQLLSFDGFSATDNNIEKFKDQIKLCIRKLMIQKTQLL